LFSSPGVTSGGGSLSDRYMEVNFAFVLAGQVDEYGNFMWRW